MPKNMSLEEWGKRSEALLDDFYAIPGCEDWSYKVGTSRKNEIAYAVNCKVSEEEAGLKDKFEKAYYDYLWKEAELHQEAYGFWPVFEMGEIESNDPRLDRYSESDSAENWAADRKTKRTK